MLFAENAPASGLAGGLGSLAPVLLMVAIFYFIVLRPARKERTDHQTMLGALMRGDEVITQAGIVGTIADIADPFVTLEIARNVKIRVLKSSISKKASDLKTAAPAAEKKEESAKS